MNFFWRWFCRGDIPRLFHCWHSYLGKFSIERRRAWCVGPRYFSNFSGYDKCCHCETYRWSHGMLGDTYEYSQQNPTEVASAPKKD